MSRIADLMKLLSILAIFIQAIDDCTCNEVCEYFNLAKGKPAIQKSDHPNHYASRGVDGGKFTCSHTNSHTNNWWVLDLQEEVHICRISYFTEHTSSQRLPDMIVGTMNFAPNPGEELDHSHINICGQFPSGRTGELTWYNFDCDVTARYVVLKQWNIHEHLTVCELEVYKFVPASEACDWSNNLALKKSTSSRTSHSSWTSNYAVDGNTQVYTDGNPPCYHASSNSEEWLAVQLDESTEICAVWLLNRIHAPERLANVVIGVSETMPSNGQLPISYDTCTTTASSSVAADMRYHRCDTDRYGSVVTLKGSTYLTVCEIQVFGYLQKPTYNHIGCFYDSPRILAVSELTQTNSLAYCMNRCKQLANYRYFGVQNGQDCWCGNDISQGYANGQGSGCSVVCTGNSGQICGGVHWMNIYEIVTSTPAVSSSRDACQLRNIAKEKSVSMRQVHSAGYFGVDGGMYTCSHVSHSNSNNWWQLDLGSVTHICRISIYTEGGAEARNYDLMVGTMDFYLSEGSSVSHTDIHQCGFFPHGTYARNWYHFDCDYSARYVVLKQWNVHEYLTVCEIEVYEYVPRDEACDWSNNLAYGQSTSYRTVYHNWGPNNVVDGNLDTTSSDICYVADGSDGNEWIAIQLPQTIDICSVWVLNRNSFVERLENVEVGISSTMPSNGQWPIDYNLCYTTDSSAVASEMTYISCSEPRFGNVVIFKGTTLLTMCEIKVYGYLDGGVGGSGSNDDEDLLSVIVTIDMLYLYV